MATCAGNPSSRNHKESFDHMNSYNRNALPISGLILNLRMIYRPCERCKSSILGFPPRELQQPRHSNFFSNSSETQEGTFDLRISAIMMCFIIMQSLWSSAPQVCSKNSLWPFFESDFPFSANSIMSFYSCSHISEPEICLPLKPQPRDPYQGTCRFCICHHNIHQLH